MKTFCSCFQAICWGRALRTRGVQWAPQGGAAGLFARGQRRRRLRLLWNTEPLTLRVKMSVGPGSDLNTVSLGCAASCNIDIRRSVRIPRKCQQEAFTVLFYILSGDLWNTGGTPMPWSYWPCRNCRQPKILRPHQNGNSIPTVAVGIPCLLWRYWKHRCVSCLQDQIQKRRFSLCAVNSINELWGYI